MDKSAVYRSSARTEVCVFDEAGFAKIAVTVAGDGRVAVTCATFDAPPVAARTAVFRGQSRVVDTNWPCTTAERMLQAASL